jgi:hypothetical protein
MWFQPEKHQAVGAVFNLALLALFALLALLQSILTTLGCRFVTPSTHIMRAVPRQIPTNIQRSGCFPIMNQIIRLMALFQLDLHLFSF